MAQAPDRPACPDTAPRARSATFDADTVRQRLRELAFLNAGAAIRFRALPAAGAAPAAAAAAPARGANGAAPAAKRSASANGAARGVPAAPGAPEQADGAGWEELACPGGLRDYVAFLNRDRQPLHAPIYLSQQARRGAPGGAPCRPAGPLRDPVVAPSHVEPTSRPCGVQGCMHMVAGGVRAGAAPGHASTGARHSTAQQDCLPCPSSRAVPGRAMPGPVQRRPGQAAVAARWRRQAPRLSWGYSRPCGAAPAPARTRTAG